MKEIEIFGIPALFTEKRIDHDAVYPGMYRYELETVNNGYPKRVSDTASGTFLGTVLTPVPIPMDNGQRELAPDDLMLDAEAGSWTPQEFEEKYLSPNGENGGDRMQKEIDLLSFLSCDREEYQALSLGLPLRQQEAARSGTSRCTGGTLLFLDEQAKRNMVRFGTRSIYPWQQRT